MKTLATTPTAKTVLTDAGEGHEFTSIRPNAPRGRYLVVFHPVTLGAEKEESKHFDNMVDAWGFYRFQAGHELYRQAIEAGLCPDVAELVAQRKISLDVALGDADMDSECDQIEWELMEDNGTMGGEDDDTPPLEVLMAGGWNAWDYQNEKNAWLDTRF